MYFRKTSIVYLKFAILALLPMIVFLIVLSTYWLRLTVEDLKATHDRDIAQTISMFDDIAINILSSDGPPQQMSEELKQVAQAFSKKPGVSCIQMQTLEFQISFPPFAFCENIDIRAKIDKQIAPQASYSFLLNSKYLDEIETRAKRNTNLFVMICSILLLIFTSFGIALSYSGRFREILHLNKLMFENNPVPTAHVDKDLKIFDLSQSWISTFRVGGSWSIRNIIDESTHVRLLGEIQALKIEEKTEIELEIPLKTLGASKETFIAKIATANPEWTSFYISLVNIEAKLQELNFRKQQTLRDNLTGCYTRAALLEKFAAGNYRSGTEFVMIDIIDFKSVNDLYGHEIGDQFLQEFVNGVQEIFSYSHDLYRLGGAEFVLVEKEANSTNNLKQNIAKLSAREISVQQDLIVRSVFAGVSKLKSDDTVSSILSRCDRALMEAKNSGKNPVMDYNQIVDIFRFEYSDIDFQNAMENEEFVYHFQPIFCTNRKRFVGLEGLIRWDKGKTILSPSEFLEGFSQYLTRTKQRSYQHKLFAKFSSECSMKGINFVSYNVTKADLLDFEFENLLIELTPVLSQCEVVLELSENMMFSTSPDQNYIEKIEEMRAAGFRIALDDFGKDLSNLNRLLQIDVDVVKLDRSLTHNCAADHRKLTTLKCFAELFSDLKIDVIAEGMESASEVEAIKDIGINLHQGFFYMTPAAASSVNQKRALQSLEKKMSRGSET